MKREIDKYPNLIPNSERSPSELQEMGRKGGMKSGETRRKKRDLQKIAKVWLEMFDELEKQGADIDEFITKLGRIYKK